MKELKYVNKTHSIVMNESTDVIQKRLFINQTYLLGTELLQQVKPFEQYRTSLSS